MLKPMLAVDAPKELDYPLYASFKIDGIRATVQNGLFISRSLKELPNKFIQSIDKSEIELFDGELVIGSPTSKNEDGISDCYRKTSSAVMSLEGEPDITFYVFDYLGSPKSPYCNRLKELRFTCSYARAGIKVTVLEQRYITNEKQLNDFEKEALDTGYEGLIIRHITAPYKHGRSTQKQGYLLKVKRFVDSEAEVIEVVQQTANKNEKFENELGRTQRSTSKSGLVPVEAMGALRVSDVHTGAIFSIGTGFTAKERADIWANRKDFVGLTVKYKHFPIGAKDLPRMPVFLGIRNTEDMS